MLELHYPMIQFLINTNTLRYCRELALILYLEVTVV